MTHLSLPLARKLKNRGLRWHPQHHDFFAIPDRGLDDRIFVISDMLSSLGELKGAPVVLFHGTVEWALDYLVSSEAIWLPTEGQLRDVLHRLLERSARTRSPTDSSPGATESALLFREGIFQCRISLGDQSLTYEADNAVEAYAQAILDLLPTESPAEES